MDALRYMVVLGMVLVIGVVACGAPAAAPPVQVTPVNQNQPNPTIQRIDHYLDGIKGDRKLDEANRKLDAIEKAVTQKAITVVASPTTVPRWTEVDVIAIVRDKLAEDIRSCRTDSALRCGNDLFGLMLLTRAPPGIPTSTTATWFIEAWWSAVYEPKNLRWLVVSMTDASANGSPGSLYFYVYERTGLVEGIAPTSQQTLDTVLRFLDEICRNDKGACTNQRSWEEIRTGRNLLSGS